MIVCTRCIIIHNSRVDSSYHISTNGSVRRGFVCGNSVEGRDIIYSPVCTSRKAIIFFEVRYMYEGGPLMSTMYVLARVCVWVLGFHKLHALGVPMGFLESLSPDCG